MVADLHAMTTPYDPQELKNNIREVVLDYLAAGLDPQKASVFVQSHVPEHTELAYLLSTAVSIARLSHLPTYKEKVKQYPKNNTMALLYYPILMAADILLYKTEALPVGDDQLPHLEITREIARKMNETYHLNFPEPTQIKTTGAYIPSLTGEGKMSKSVEGSYINLTDDLNTIKAKLAKVPSDSGKGEILDVVEEKTRILPGKSGSNYYYSGGKRRDGVNALMELIRLFCGDTRKKEYEGIYENAGIQYGDMKDELSEAIYAKLKPIQARRAELEKDPDYIDKVLADGAAKAHLVASETVKEVKQKMGL